MTIGLTTAQLNFEIIQEIGQEGKNSQVFIAHDKQLDTELVIKKIEKSKIEDSSNYFTESKRLYDSEHPHVVQIKYACEDNDYIYLAMPLYKNGSLKKLIDSRFLTVREIIRYATQFLSGLHNIHVKGLIHFDIKPDNILISDKNEALVADFGLAKSMNSLGYSSIDLVYPNQMPPELFSQSEHSMLYDIYNSGLTLYRMCNGNAHFYEQFSQFSSDAEYISAISSGAFPNRKSYIPHIPRSLQKVINTALKVNQIERHKTVLCLINELSSIDELLDWQYDIIDNKSIWILEQEERKFTVELSSNNGIFAIESNKIMTNSGKKTRITDACVSNIKLEILDKTINSILSKIQ